MAFQCGFNVPSDIILSDDRRDIVLWQGASEIKAKVDLALQVFSGTWVFDSQFGLRDFQRLFGKPADVAYWKSEVSRVVSQVAGIIRVRSVRTSYDSVARALTVSWVAESDVGILSSEVSYQ
jgi:hypothetical protein